MNDTINDYLHKLGLADIEAHIYCVLLKNGPATMTELADICQNPRTTIFENAQKLIQKGLVSRVILKNKQQLVAEQPSKIELLLQERGIAIKEQQLQLAVLQKQMPQFLHSMESLVTSPYETNDFEIKTFEGRKEISFLFKEICKSGELQCMGDERPELQLFPNNYDLYIRALEENKAMKIWDIIVPHKMGSDFLSRVDTSRYFYKYFPDNLKTSIPIEYLILDNYRVVHINFTQVPKGIMIRNKYYHQHAKSLFEFIWNTIP